jgi:protein TonB
MLESSALAAALLVPLAANGGKPLQLTLLAPRPPYRGSPQAAETPRLNAGGKRGPGWFIPAAPILQPPHIPHNIIAGDSQPPSLTGPDAGGPLGLPDGVLDAIGSREHATPIPKPPVPEPRPPADKEPPLFRSEHVQQALLVYQVRPAYPTIARQARIQGTVRLRARIGRDGAVREVEVLCGHPVLAHAAVEAIREWRYRPTLLHGQPVEVETHITVIFTLGP